MYMDIKSQIESLLFISQKPVAIKQLMAVFKIGKKDAIKIMDEIIEKYNTVESGIHIMKKKGWQKDEFKYQMVTNSKNSEFVYDFIKEEISGELTRPSLETLTIIAYRGPISKSEIEQIRGVNCSLILKNLLIRGLVEEKEDNEKMIKYYNVTADFVRYLGIRNVEDLPNYKKLNSNRLINEMFVDENV